MKKIAIILASMLMLNLVWCCNDEDAPKATWEYLGPRPVITDGPAPAQKMCYQLYQKYDLHVYYNLSGREALIGGLGDEISVNPIIDNNADALPMQAADEAVAEKFLKILIAFCDLLPKDLVVQDFSKRKVLVKVNPGENRYRNDSGQVYWLNAHWDYNTGVIYYGYLDDQEDTGGDRFDTNLYDWKWGICYEFFQGLAAIWYGKDFPIASKFGAVSKGLYYNENETDEDICLEYDYDEERYIFYQQTAKECGFVHPLGVKSSSKSCERDWGSYVAWILMTPKAERETDMAAYERIKLKYDMTIKYCQETYNVDLEDLSVKWQKIIL